MAKCTWCKVANERRQSSQSHQRLKVMRSTTHHETSGIVAVAALLPLNQQGTMPPSNGGTHTFLPLPIDIAAIQLNHSLHLMQLCYFLRWYFWSFVIKGWVVGTTGERAGPLGSVAIDWQWTLMYGVRIDEVVKTLWCDTSDATIHHQLTNDDTQQYSTPQSIDLSHSLDIFHLNHTSARRWANWCISTTRYTTGYPFITSWFNEMSTPTPTPPSQILFA